VRAYDPEGTKEARTLLKGVEWRADAYDALKDADAGVIVTEWNQFRALDLPRLGKIMKRPLLVDLRNIYRPDEVAAAGIAYHSIGRAPVEGR
jgi:UDPglucose 6-dehydrogenase